MQIFSGSTNQPLAQKIATELKTEVGKVELSQFPNGEIRVWANGQKVHKEVAVVQSFAGDPNHAIMEFCLLVDALRRSGAKEITAVIPWMGYCIQDKIFREGEPLSARVVANIIESAKVDRVITVDLHNESIQGFFSLPIIHLSAVPLFLEMFSSQESKLKSQKITTPSRPNNPHPTSFSLNPKPCVDVVIAPDVGALKETTKIAHALDIPIATLNKKRDLKTGKVEIVGMDGEIAGKRALIMDDFISTGGTMVQTADYLKDHGMTHITVAATHFLGIEGVMEKLAKSGIDELYITDTIESENSYLPDKNSEFQLTIVSVAEMIAVAL